MKTLISLNDYQELMSKPDKPNALELWLLASNLFQDIHKAIGVEDMNCYLLKSTTAAGYNDVRIVAAPSVTDAISFLESLGLEYVTCIDRIHRM